jgi:hypothetical protein
MVIVEVGGQLEDVLEVAQRSVKGLRLIVHEELGTEGHTSHGCVFRGVGGKAGFDLGSLPGQLVGFVDYQV